MSDKLFTIVAGVNGADKRAYIARLFEKPNMLGHIIDPDQIAVKYAMRILLQESVKSFKK